MRALAAAVSALLLALGACGGGNDAANGTVLTMARPQDAVVLDPSHATDGASLAVTGEVMQNLVTLAPGTFTVAGDAAARWSSNRDGTVWTFELRPHLVFSDGMPLDAAAVKFNFDRWRLPSDPAHGAFSYAGYVRAFGGLPGAIADVRAPAPARVVIRLARPLGAFLHDIAEPSFAIGSPAAIRADPNAFERTPVGSGPYVVAEWQRGDHITLVANPRYAGPKPGFGTVIVRDVPDQATGVLSIEKGDADMLTDPQLDDVKRLGTESGLRVVEQPSNSVAYLALDATKKPFGDVRVRRAIAYAIDAGAIAGLFPSGTTPAANWTPPGMLGANPSATAYPRDVRTARALLAAAGFPHGMRVTLSYPIAPRAYLPEPERVAELLQAQLADAGIAVTPAPDEPAAEPDEIEHCRRDMCLGGGSAGNGDPDDLFDLLDRNAAQGTSPQRDLALHRLILAGRTATSDAQRASIYRQANAIVHDQVPAIPLVHAPVPIVLRSALKGFVPSPNNSYHFASIHGS
ncbi:MAG TPA: ABC transporter substrate-binding protein [Candidatus Elarobacter sp.]|nr:ABC transporter substrate-binding protein [Candidatus Elarobacter sp.]